MFRSESINMKIVLDEIYTITDNSCEGKYLELISTRKPGHIVARYIIGAKEFYWPQEENNVQHLVDMVPIPKKIKTAFKLYCLSKVLKI